MASRNGKGLRFPAPPVVYQVESPVVLAGRRFEPGDLMVIRPSHPDRDRRVVVEVGLPESSLVDLSARNELADALTQLPPLSDEGAPPTPPRRRGCRRSPLRLVT